MGITGDSGGLLEGRVVLVSGGTQGIGAAVAAAAVRNGADVVVTGRREAEGEAAAERLRGLAVGHRVAFLPCDVADLEQVHGVVEEVVGTFGRVDCLVNAAGLTTRGSLVDTTPELFDQHVAVNLRGPFFLMQAVVRDMLARGEGGTVVNVITMSAHGGQPYLAPYAATKAALVGLTKNAAHAHRWDRIRINGLNIGWSETEGEDAVQRRFHGADDGWLEQAATSQPMGRLGQPDEIADAVVFLLSDRSGVVTGSVLDWDQQVLGAYD